PLFDHLSVLLSRTDPHPFELLVQIVDEQLGIVDAIQTPQHDSHNTRTITPKGVDDALTGQDLSACLDSVDILVADQFIRVPQRDGTRVYTGDLNRLGLPSNDAL